MEFPTDLTHLLQHHQLLRRRVNIRRVQEQKNPPPPVGPLHIESYLGQKRPLVPIQEYLPVHHSPLLRSVDHRENLDVGEALEVVRVSSDVERQLMSPRHVRAEDDTNPVQAPTVPQRQRLPVHARRPERVDVVLVEVVVGQELEEVVGEGVP